MNQPTKVFVTGAGGPAAVSFFRSLQGGEFEFFMGDLDPNAAGLYLVPASHRFLLPPGGHPNYVNRLLALCVSLEIDLLVPTVDCELIPVADARGRFESAGIRLLLTSAASLRKTLDKLETLRACESSVPVPRYAVFDEAFDPTGWRFPVIVKPRSASGSRGVVRVDSSEELAKLIRSERLLVQEFLPGEEYSVDVWCDQAGRAQVAVPRVRAKVDSAITVTGRTFHDQHLESAAMRVAEALGVSFVANVQFRRDVRGTAKLLEVNARFPGTMPLTVASGVHMPRLSVLAALGQPVECPSSFKETAVVRFWEDAFFSPSELLAMRAGTAAAA